jgi:hypothetical protein
MFSLLQATFEYTVRDSAGQTASATVTITVTGLLARPDTANVTSGSQVTIRVLANDQGTGLSITSVGPVAPGQGSAVRSGSNVVYTAPGSFSGTVRHKRNELKLCHVSTIMVRETSWFDNAAYQLSDSLAGWGGDAFALCMHANSAVWK